MTPPAPLDEVARRLEANLKTDRRLDTPLGTVGLGGQVYIRRDVGGMALSATLDAVKGRVFKKTSQVLLELVALEAGTLDKLKALVADHESRLRNRLDLHTVLAVFSASGWDEKAREYVRNDPPGSGYAFGSLHLVLIGPAPTDVVTCAHDDVVRSLRPILRGRTDEEEEAVTREHLEKALTLDNYAVLERVARDGDLDPVCVERAARALASGSADLRIDVVRGAGIVLRRKGD